MYKLVRDKIPELLQQSNQICNYAAIGNDEFFIFALKQKLVEEVNEFLSSQEVIDVDELVDIQTVINSFVELSVGKTKFKTLYDQKLDARGSFSKKYIAFFEDNKETPQE